jgi:tRNA 2-thiouridine synthesizing protein A
MSLDSADPSPAAATDLTRFDQEWDAGDLGCGDLVLRLRFRMREMQAGEVMRLRATDPGAPQDIPAWCRMTGETLVHHDPQSRCYYIRRTGR